MTEHLTVGTYFLKGQDPSTLGLDVHDAIGEIVARQVALRGDDKPFNFKALGYKWRYVPQSIVESETGKVGKIVKAAG
jgi:hypothetical protein